MFCKFCGKELDPDAAFCPYCGKKQREPEADTHTQAQQTEEPSSGQSRPQRRGIISVVIVIIAALVVLAAGISIARSNSGSGRGTFQVISQPKLSETNVAAANKAIEIVDKYLAYDTVEELTYGSQTATDDLLKVKNSLITESDAAAEEIRQELIGYIDQIVDQLDLNEKTLSNLSRVLNGGDTTDRDEVQALRDKIETLVSKYS